VDAETLADLAAETVLLHLPEGPKKRLKVGDVGILHEIGGHEVFGMLFSGGKERTRLGDRGNKGDGLEATLSCRVEEDATETGRDGQLPYEPTIIGELLA
jgi:hypothetical protein